MADLLTPNILRAIFENEGQPVANTPNPVVQILAVKQIKSTAPGALERWRVVLNDGNYYAQAMLATQLNAMVTNNEIQKGGFLRLGQYTMNKLKDKRYGTLVTCFGGVGGWVGD